MPNASEHGPHRQHARKKRTRRRAASCEIADITSTRAVLAVQGPQARARLERGRRLIWPAVPRFEVARGRHGVAVDCIVAGTGYTGEDGVEIHVPAEHARRALAGGRRGRGRCPRAWARATRCAWRPACRCTDTSSARGSPRLQAGLGWVVRFDKGDFRGREPLLAERERGVARRLRGLLVEGRRPPRAGYAVTRDAETIGEVTSGNFSPTLERAIALGVPPARASRTAPRWPSRCGGRASRQRS